MQVNLPWAEFIICYQEFFKNFNWIASKHNFMLNPKWKWYLLKVLTFKTRYNNQHAHPNVKCTCKTKENMPLYIHKNLLLNVNSNEKNLILQCVLGFASLDQFES
jgi:hypothetical protein